MKDRRSMRRGLQHQGHYRMRFLPARAEVQGSALEALRRAHSQAAGEAPTYRLGADDGGQAGELALILHPRDARQLRLRALALGGAERMAALRSQLEASLLEDVHDLVIAARFETRAWVAGLANRNWIAQLLAAAEEQNLRLAGIWPAQACLAVREPAALQKVAERDGAQDAAESLDRSRISAASGEDAEMRSDAWVWPPRDRAIGPLDPAMNLLEALLLHRQEDPWAGLRGDGGWLPRRLLLALARVRWALRTMPAQAWKQPLGALLALIACAGLALEADTVRMRGQLAEREAEVARLFRDIVPGTQAMVDPVVQAQRVLEQWRRNPSSSADSQPDPLAAVVLAHAALSRAGGEAAVAAVRALEWKGREGSAGGVLSVRWQAGALDATALRPITQEIAARAAWSVQWGGSGESMMQWRAPAPEGAR